MLIGVLKCARQHSKPFMRIGTCHPQSILRNTVFAPILQKRKLRHGAALRVGDKMKRARRLVQMGDLCFLPSTAPVPPALPENHLASV